MYCNKCGKHNPENSNYCKYCGSKIEKVSAVDESNVNNAKEHANESENKKVKGGLSGWIALLGLGIILNPFIYGYSLLGYFPLFNQSYDIQGYMPLLQFEFVITIIIFLSSIYFLFLYFNKKKIFPKYYFIFLISIAVYVCIDYLLLASLTAPTPEQQKAISDSISQNSSEIGRTVIFSIIWAIYLKKSKKVKATFIND
ncbi:MAG TPA: DUF2569 family protein [Patescibacteria group bacterium]|nr:DUF2569 family protein [Patescibacteria group bacterium]